MNDTLLLVSLLAVGGLLAGAWLQRQAPARRRRAGLGVLALALLPVLALVLAGALGSKTLGWLAGLGLMGLMAVGLPLGVGALAGFVLATLVRGRAEGAAHQLPAEHATDLATGPTPGHPPRPVRAAQTTAVSVSPATPGATQCPHLQPLEQVLCSAGLNVRRLAGADLEVQAVLEPDALAPLPDGVRAEEPVRPDERGAPEQLARLYCTRCAASLWFIHPQRALATTPRFRPQ